MSVVDVGVDNLQTVSLIRVKWVWLWPSQRRRILILGYRDAHACEVDAHTATLPKKNCDDDVM